MTTPNQPYPAWMSALGLGAFELGGTGGGTGTEGSYGQNITESLVNGLVYGPLSQSNVTASSGAVEDVVSVMTSMLATLPISALKYLQPFIPGATDADFVDSATATNFIANQFIPKTTVDTLTWLGRFLQDLEILFDIFHITYPVGAPTDVAGQTSWYAAWNDLLELIGLTSGTTPTTAAPTIGTAITAAGTAGVNGSAWSTRLTNDLLILLDVFHLTYTSTQWNSAWTDLLSLFGIVNSVTTPTNPTPTIGPAITSAQSSATTAGTNASTAISNAAAAQTTANTGVTNASTAQGTANTAVTNAGTAQTAANTNATRTARKAQNDLIIGDWFHTTYPIGSISDTAATLVGGKRTWWGAWNDNLTLLGILLGITAPTDPASDVGTSIAANTAAATTAGTNASIAIASNQSVVDQVNQAMTGVATTGQPLSSVLGNLTAIPATNVVGNTGAAVTWGATGVGSSGGPTSNTASATWSHTPAPTDLAVDVYINYTHSGTMVTSSTVTYGGTAMTQVKTVTQTGLAGVSFTLEHWRISVTPTGSPSTATIVATGSRVSGATGNMGITGNSVSYYAAKILTESVNSGSSATTDSQTATSSTGKMLVGVFAMQQGSTSYATVNQTQRSKQTVGSNPILWIGDAAGASSVTFNVSTGTGTSVTWAGFTVELSN